jgi:hypothetical protein
MTSMRSAVHAASRNKPRVMLIPSASVVRTNFIAPLPIGLALFVAELASGALEISLFLEIPEY